MIMEGTEENDALEPAGAYFSIQGNTIIPPCVNCDDNRKRVKDSETIYGIGIVAVVVMFIVILCSWVHNDTLSTELLDAKEKAQFVKNDLRDARQEERILQENIFSMLQEKGDLERQIRSKQLKPTPKGNMVSLQVSARFEDGHTQTVIVPNVPTLPTYHQ